MNDFEGNKNMFWTNGMQSRDEMINDVNGQMLGDGVEVRRKWLRCAEYFEQVLNVEDVWGTNIR